jgi:hypothetical protein
MIRPEEFISFEGRDWTVLKAWLQEMRNQKIGLLIQSENHDKSNQIRGSLAMIQQILQLENAAEQAAQRKHNG